MVELNEWDRRAITPAPEENGFDSWVRAHRFGWQFMDNMRRLRTHAPFTRWNELMDAAHARAEQRLAAHARVLQRHFRRKVNNRSLTTQNEDPTRPPSASTGEERCRKLPRRNRDRN